MDGGKGVSASSYDNDEKIEWKEIDRYSFTVIHSASVDEKRKRNAKKRQGNFVNYDIDLIAETEAYINEYIISDNYGHTSTKPPNIVLPKAECTASTGFAVSGSIGGKSCELKYAPKS